MKTSDDIAKIGEALAKSQFELQNVTKDRTNPHFNSTYATLAAVLDVCRPVLAANGIAIIQTPANEEGGRVSVTTRLLHASGEWLECMVATVPMKQDAQGIGSVLTYLRRYSLAAMCGVAQEDDDGNAGSAAPGSKTESKPKTQTRKADPEPADEPIGFVDDADRKSFMAYLNGKGIKYEAFAAWLEAGKKPRPSAMTVEQRHGVVAAIETPATRAKFDGWLAAQVKDKPAPTHTEPIIPEDDIPF